MRKIAVCSGCVLLVLILAALILFSFLDKPLSKAPIKYGVTVSLHLLRELELDPKLVVSELLDTGVEIFRITVYWDLHESQKGSADFKSLEGILDIVKSRRGQIVLAVGMKVPRWPECFIPEWAMSLPTEEREAALREFMRKTVIAFRGFPGLKYWQVENEYFLDFGICPNRGKNVLDHEIVLVKSLDPGRPILLTDSGERMLASGYGVGWLRLAHRADIYGGTLYRSAWDKRKNYFIYGFSESFYRIRWNLVKVWGPDVIVAELQAEPFLKPYLNFRSVDSEETGLTMNPKFLVENLAFVEAIRPSEVYLWGAEWAYWLCFVRQDCSMWNIYKNRFNTK